VGHTRMAYLSDRVKIEIASNTTAGAAGTADITTAAVDTAGYEGVLFIVPLGTIVSGAVTSIKVQQCDTTGGSYADLTGSAQTIADTDDDKLLYVDVYRPQEQFLKLIVDRGTQNTTVGGVVAIKYGKRTLGTASHGTGVSGEQWTGPAEGTA
jgi:hypothetical protein